MATATKLTAFLNADVVGFEKGMRQASRGMETFGRNAGKTSNLVSASLSRIGIALAGIVGTRALVQIADEMTQLKARTDLSTQSVEESAQAWKGLNAIVAETGGKLSSAVEIFQRLSFSRNEIKATTQEMLQFTETVSKLGVVSGASAGALQSGLMQLGQALSSDIVRAEEFNSIMENIPVVGKAIADEFGISTGKLRQLVIEGKVLSSDVFAAILNQTAKANEEFDKMPLTIERATGQLKNQFMLLISGANDATQASENIAKAISFAADMVSKVRVAFLGLKAIALEFYMVQTRMQVEMFAGLRNYVIFLSKAVPVLKNQLLDLENSLWQAAQQSADAHNRAKDALAGLSDEAGKFVIEQAPAPTTRPINTDYKKMAEGLSGVAAQTKNVSQATKQADADFKDFNDTVIDFRSASSNAMSGFVSDLQRGEDSLQSLKNLALNVLQEVLQSVINGVGKGSSSGIGGLLSGGLGDIFGGQGGLARLFQKGSTGFIGPLAGFATGSDYINRDQLAMLHKGEMVIPAQQVSKMENSHGGNVINIDARGAEAGVEQKIRNVVASMDQLRRETPNIALSAVAEENKRNPRFLS